MARGRTKQGGDVRGEAKVLGVTPKNVGLRTNPGACEEVMKGNDGMVCTVTNDDKQGPVPQLDAVLNQRSDPWVDLLPGHGVLLVVVEVVWCCGGVMLCVEPGKMRVMMRRMKRMRKKCPTLNN